jgi:hypothetical protein
LQRSRIVNESDDVGPTLLQRIGDDGTLSAGTDDDDS